MKKLGLIGLGIFAVWLSSCSVAKQIDMAKTFAKCDFSVQNIEHMQLADIKIQNVKSAKDLSLKKAAQLTDALTKKTLPLTFTINLSVENPNEKPAGMSRLEWIVLIDNNEIVRGALDQIVEILPDSDATVPLNIEMDLKKSFSNESAESLVKLAFNLAGEGDKPTRITVKVKPTINVAGLNIEYPGYIDVHTKINSEQGKQLRKKAAKKAKK